MSLIESEIVSRVNSLMQSGFELPADRLKPDALLKEDLGLDSLDAVDMLVYLEENFGRRIEGERIMQVKTLNDVYTLVREASDAEVSGETVATIETVATPNIETVASL